MSEQSRDRKQRIVHRLVGGLVLVALALIILPMVMDFEVGEDVAITRTNIPERPAGLRVEEIPLLPPEAPLHPPNTEASPPPPAAAARSWVVRVGSFGNAENANALCDQIRSKGFPAFVDEVRVNGKTLSRVQVGPETERARGDALRDRLKRELDLDGMVVAYE
ncbi:MAG: SPOR domain-containing protein [Chromatiales bacterium]|jgi:DedD protein|nr:SPOR domain-containing protein [Chromatiales bacterium]